MRQLALPPEGAVVLLVELLARVVPGRRSLDVPADEVREVTVHTVLTVPREVMNAGVFITRDMHFLVFAFFAIALVRRKVLLRAKSLDAYQFRLQFLVLYVVFVQMHHGINNG
jgi:hypothetical protein